MRAMRLPLRLFSNIRLGGATNSSSTHSVVLMPEDIAATLKDEDFDPGDTTFGWGNFTLRSPESKAAYLLTQITEFYERRSLSHDEAATLAAVAVNPDGIDPVTLAEAISANYSIDHQSALTFPRPHNGSRMSDYWAWLRHSVIDNDNVVILGGNDNSDGHPLAKCGSEITIATCRDYGVGDDVFRANDDGSITIYEPWSGNKIRTTPTNAASERSNAPELIDMKITNQCSAGCKFCYQDSTPDGEHAETRRIMRLIDDMGDAAIFEIAIGGGEPTAHPDLITILQAAERAHVAVSFSTRSMAWLEDKKRAQKVFDLTTDVAFSTNSITEMRRWAQAISGFTRGRYKHGARTVIHYVLGLDTRADLMEFLDAAKESRVDRVVLLAFKTTGRAANLTATDYAWWQEAITEFKRTAYHPMIAVDAFLASEITPESKFVPQTYEASDGLHSMYIDAVTGRFGAHSAGAPMYSLDGITGFDGETIRQAWRTIAQNSVDMIAGLNH